MNLQTRIRPVHFLPAAVILMFILGCRSCDTIDSTKLDPSEIYQDYTISASNDGTIVSATFRAGGSTGTTIELLSPSKVEYNGKPMTANVRTFLNGTFYTSGSNGFSSSNTFFFTDASGNRFSNSVNISPIEINGENIQIKQGMPAEIVISRPLANGERATISIVSETKPPASNTLGNSSNNGRSNSSNSNNEPPPLDYSSDITPGAGSEPNRLKIAPEWLKNFVQGKATMKIVISSSALLQQTGIRGGALNYNIYSPEVGVTIEK